MNQIRKSAIWLAAASDGNPVLSVVVVMLSYLGFSLIEAMIETLIWGDRFAHWLDPLFVLAFMAYGAYSVYACAIYNGVCNRED